VLALARIGLQLVLFFVLLSAVIGVGSADTGAFEKAALVALGVAVVWIAPHVRRIGRQPPGLA
jgi:hypothetical protein